MLWSYTKLDKYSDEYSLRLNTSFNKVCTTSYYTLSANNLISYFNALSLSWIIKCISAYKIMWWAYPWERIIALELHFSNSSKFLRASEITHTFIMVK